MFEIFNDVIIRKEDILNELRFVPGDLVRLTIDCRHNVKVYVVKSGEEPTEKGEVSING